MDIAGHIAILRRAFDAPPTMSRSALRLVMLANAAVDVRQTTPALHFDNAPDRETLIHHWRASVARPLAQIVAWCAPRPDGRSRVRALWAYGQLTHTLQDFYAHTNWVEVHLAPQHRTITAPLLATTLTAAELPADLHSGYFSLRYFTPRHRWSGCPVVAGQCEPPRPYSHCHAQLAKDTPKRGAGSQHTADGTRHYDIAARLATRTTRDSFAALKQRMEDAAAGRGHGTTAFAQLFGLAP